MGFYICCIYPHKFVTILYFKTGKQCVVYCYFRLVVCFFFLVDDSKFGQKMLEKFGWSKGKGLGAKEDGHVDHVKVSLKNDSLGE